MVTDLSRGLLHAAFYCRQAEIARLLKNRNADAENINDDNVAPLFHLFQPGSRNTSAVAQELLDIALPDLVSNINLRSCEGWTVLHRAAAYGCSKDIDTLLGLGADSGQRTDEMKWLPLATAVHFGNLSTVEQLLSYMDMKAVRETDSRGWTILQLAAEQGDPQIVASLVSADGDLHTWSEMVPPALDVARGLGAERLENFVHGLQMAGFDVQLDDGEVFWDAED